MYFADYHTHSRVSPDAFSSMTEMAEAAIRQGQALLRECDFRRFCTFRQGQPVWHDL